MIPPRSAGNLVADALRTYPLNINVSARKNVSHGRFIVELHGRIVLLSVLHVKKITPSLRLGTSLVSPVDTALCEKLGDTFAQRAMNRGANAL